MNRLKGIDPDYNVFIAFNAEERKYLKALADSARRRERKLCLHYLDANLLVRGNYKFNLHLLDHLVQDKDNDIKWHAFRALGDFVSEHPRQVWPFVIKYGSVFNPDTRQAVACTLLEHLLAEHFDNYWPKVKRIVLAGNRRFWYTLACCWPMGQPKSQWKQIADFINKNYRK